MLVCLALTSLADRAEAADDPIPDPETASVGLYAPTLGRPVFVEPGSSFPVRAAIPGGDGTVRFTLIQAGRGDAGTYGLEIEPGTPAKLAAGQAVRVRVPPNVPRRTYDLEIRSGTTRLVGRHCVAVGYVDRSLRLVHVSNMNVGELGAPEFDERLVDEVNLLAPTLIVATGDYLDATCSESADAWARLVDYLTRFDAPLVMACGDHDDIGHYSRHVAPSPIGLTGVGAHRCLILYDHALAPIHRNPEQVHWLENALAHPGFDGLTLVVTHDGSPNLLRYWREAGTLQSMIHAGRIGLWFSGGHRDWDGQAYRELLDGTEPMVYLRTHQSSPAPREGATGVSHYRIVDVVDERVFLPGAAPGSSEVPGSTPVGHLGASVEGRNDGSEARLEFSAHNNLPYRLNGLALTLRLRKLAGQTPWCQGARLAEVTDLGTQWECRVWFDLPDKGALRAVAGSGPEPATAAVAVEFAGPSQLHFRRLATSEGLTFFNLHGDAPVVHVRNNGQDAVDVSPLARFDGDTIAYRPAASDARYATAYRLHLEPRETVSLQLDLSAVRVASGRRELQIYLDGGAVMAPFCHAVDVGVVD